MITGPHSRILVGGLKDGLFFPGLCPLDPKTEIWAFNIGLNCFSFSGIHII